MEECWAQYPMVHDAVLKADVMEFWSKQPFDLQIHGDKGNCDLCFLKGAGKLVRLIRDEPHLAKWWMEKEEGVTKLATRKNDESKAQFSQRHTYRELLDMALKNQIPEDGPEAVDCFCGIDE